ncbi:hypothetical protein BDV98DRAFT_588529 [Pterulicium gracile]|uniref:Uncharacterized protein n=1 Tax=Pterulicium gracile TaxID=1884261 RepID=A0A5C3QZJ8_9AGAR|nr:hypothetical protein BDV98DRAFT_588529 [Pterula gracilis]
MTPDYGEKEQALPFRPRERPALHPLTAATAHSWLPMMIRYFLAASFLFLLGFFYAHATLPGLAGTRCQPGSPTDPCSFFEAGPREDPRTDLPRTNSTSRRPQALCTQREYETGHWEPIPLVNITQQVLDFEDTLPNPYGVSWHYCAPMPDIRSAGGGRWNHGKWDEGERSDEETFLEGEKRSVGINAWEWVPEMGRECMVEWDAIDLVVRLLRSPGGLILVGDSITRQHYHSIMHLIASAGITYGSDLPTLPMADHKNVNQHTLNPASPSTALLLSLSGVPKSRILRPIVTYLEDHLFIGQADIREITYRFGAEEGYTWWYDFQRVEDWEKFVQDAARPRYGEVESVREDTVVLLNTGPHWSRNDINMLPKNKLPEEFARLRGCYAAMVDKVTARLNPIPQLSVVYRSTSPGHPGCRNRRTPYFDLRSALYHEANVRQRLLDDAENDKIRDGRKVWDWDLFPDHNDAWRSKIRSLSRRRGSRGASATKKATKGGANWLYMDIWDMSLQRPDAHNEPSDCLHWCMPVVLNEWTYLLHHVLSLQERKMELERVAAKPDSPDSSVPIHWD